MCCWIRCIHNASYIICNRPFTIGGISMFDILADAYAVGLGAFIMLVILTITDHLK